MLIPLIPITVFCSVGFLASVIKIVGNKKDKSLVVPQKTEAQRTESSLIINNVEYVFLHTPDRAGIQEAAIEFCSMKGSDLGVSVETFKECVNFVVDALHQKYSGFETKNSTGAEIWVKQPLANNIEAPWQEQTLDQVDHQLADEYQPNDTEFSKLLAEQENLQDAEFFDTQVGDAASVSQAPQIMVAINGVNYLFSFPADMTMEAGCSKLAREFCDSRRASLGLELPDPVDSDSEANTAVVDAFCSDPLVTVLRQEFTNLFASADTA